jgi:hypothetical protein
MADWQAASNTNNVLYYLFGYQSGRLGQAIGSIFGMLADFSGTIGLVQFISSLIKHDDELKPLLNAIQDGFRQLESQIAASDKLQRMRDVDEGINPAVGVFEQLPAILTSTPPASQDFELEQIQICLDAVLFFTDYDDKWQAVWADLPYYSDPWSGKLAPQADADGLVFNYTYTLPQFLRAIYIFLTAVRALAPSSLVNYQDVLNRCLTRLESVHQTVVSGIVGTRMPNAEDIVAVNIDNETGGWNAQYAWRYAPSPFPPWLYGGVEIYSGVSDVGGYMEYSYMENNGNAPIPDFYLNPIPDQWLNFSNLIRLRIIRKQKDLYRQLGLPVVRSVINQLRQLTGQPLLTEAYEAWSVGEVFSILALPPPRAIGVLGGISVEREIAAIESALTEFLLGTPPWAGYYTWVDPSGSDTWVQPIPLPTGSLYEYLTGATLEPGRHL